MSTPASPARPAPKKALGAIFLTVFLDLVGFSVIFPLFPAMLAYYLEQEGADSLIGHLAHWLEGLAPHVGDAPFLTTVLFGGVLGSLYSFVQFFSSTYWGRLSDRLGRRKILLGTIAGTALSYLLWCFAGQFWMLLLARALGGMMAGNLAVATAAVADVTDEKGRGKGMALIGVAFGLGFILGPALGAAGAHYLDLSGLAPVLNPFSGAALISLALALVNLAWVARGMPETHTPAAVATVTDNTSGKRPGRLAQIFVVKAPSVRQVIFIYLIFITAFAGMEFSLTFLAKERLAYEPIQMMRIFIFVGLMLLISQGMIVRRLVPKVGEIPLIFAGFLLVFLGLVCLGAAGGTGLFYGGLALLGLGVGLVSPTLTSAASRFSPADQQGANLGAFRSAGALGRAIGPLFGAVLFFRFGSDLAYYAGAGMVLVALVLAFMLPKLPKCD